MKTKKLNILDYASPSTDKHPVILMGWVGCIRFAPLEKEIRDCFEKETKLQWETLNNHEDYIRQFVIWANENIWGEERRK